MATPSLDILIFTYNRAPALARVLEQFAASPFRGCAITVLDNHSTDRTPEVCQEFQARLPALRAVRHLKNIGGDANYLRTIELAQAEYTWTVCDDDEFDFSGAGDILEALQSGKFDVISVGVKDSGLPGGYTGTAQAFAQAHPFFIAHSFVPSLIYRTSLFDSETLRRAYANCDTHFPHFPLLTKLVEQDVPLYVSRQTVIRKNSQVGYLPGTFLSGWLEACKRTENASVRRKAAAEVFSGRALLINLVYFILTEKALGPRQFWKNYRQVCGRAFSFSVGAWLKVLLFFPLAACPRFVHRALWQWYRGYRARRGMPLPGSDAER